MAAVWSASAAPESPPLLRQRLADGLIALMRPEQLFLFHIFVDGVRETFPRGAEAERPDAFLSRVVTAVGAEGIMSHFGGKAAARSEARVFLNEILLFVEQPARKEAFALNDAAGMAQLAPACENRPPPEARRRALQLGDQVVQRQLDARRLHG
mgnify:CR=1 FL=1